MIGDEGNGTLNISAGGRVRADASVIIGQAMGSVGEVTVDGNGSELFGGDLMFVSSFGPGTGTLTVANGGTVTALGGLSVRLLGTLRGDGQVIGNVSNIGVVAPGAFARRTARDGQLYAAGRPGHVGHRAGRQVPPATSSIHCLISRAVQRSAARSACRCSGALHQRAATSLKSSTPIKASSAASITFRCQRYPEGWDGPSFTRA